MTFQAKALSFLVAICSAALVLLATQQSMPTLQATTSSMQHLTSPVDPIFLQHSQDLCLGQFSRSDMPTHSPSNSIIVEELRLSPEVPTVTATARAEHARHEVPIGKC